METVLITSELGRRYPQVAEAIRYHCWWAGISVQNVDHTRNIWIRDWYPVKTGQINTRFRYDAYGYRKLPQLQVSEKCFSLVRYKKSRIHLDGGNVEQSNDLVLMTDMVLKKNRRLSPKKLEMLFGKRVVIVPHETCDTLGHIDGMARLSDLGCVLINDYSVMQQPIYDKYQHQLESALEKEGLKPTRMPYAYDQCPHLTDEQFRQRYPLGDDNNPSVGYYINFLKTSRVVFVPQFGFKQDRLAIEFLAAHFPNHRVIGVECFDLAMQGGLLNCVTFN